MAVDSREPELWESGEVNPFPGPQPYRATDRKCFFGRGDMAYALEASILANRCVTVYGPSGAGKSSLAQAAVIPALIEAHEVRVAHVDGWPDGEHPARWLARAMYGDLGFGDPPQDTSAGEAVLTAAKRAARRSTRLMLVHVDQIEQLLYPGRNTDETDSFFECLQGLVQLPLRNVRVILSLREDYLGRFRDRLRNRHIILQHGFRVGPLTVAELTDAVCQGAAAGEPPQTWSRDELFALMLQVRLPGQAISHEAEAQAAYAQIVCRALFQQRARGDVPAGAEVEAEPIVQGYFETALAELGPLREAAQRLLEDHLITADGSRTLRTEKELLRILPAEQLSPILRALEGAAILRADEHQGSRYFELGHDWLAKRVQERRQERERDEEQRRREHEQQQQLAKERAKRRTLLAIALAAMATVVAMWLLAIRAQRAATAAAQQAARADQEAARALAEARQARNAARMAAARELQSDSTTVLALLREVEPPDIPRGWADLARLAWHTGVATVVLTHPDAVGEAAWSPDGKRIVTASDDKTARVWNADGTGEPLVLRGHENSVFSAAWSPDGSRIVTTSYDKTARVWRGDGTGEPLILRGHESSVRSAAWSPDGSRIVTTSYDKTARVWIADGTSDPFILRGHRDELYSAAFSPDGKRIVTASKDKTARVWSADAIGRGLILRGHDNAVLSAAFSADGKRLVTASLDKTVRVRSVDGVTRQDRPRVERHRRGRAPDPSWLRSAVQSRGDQP